MSAATTAPDPERPADAAGARTRRWTRRVPAAAWACALVAVLNALAWSLITPPFHVPDENAHVAYAQYVAEAGRPAKKQSLPLSPQEESVLAALHFYDVIGRPNVRVSTGSAEEAQLAAAERTHPSPKGPGGAGSASNNPPLYYAAAAVAYRLSPGSSLLDRLAVMRVLSALIAGGTVLLTFLFLRELLPRAPWTWPLGALAVAFQPMFGFIAGGVQVDNALTLCAAGLLLAIAIALRRGLTPGRGLAIGLVLAAGLLVKTTMVAFAPAAAVAVLIAALRVRDDRRNALGGMAAAAAGLAVPVVAFVVLSTAVWHRPIAGSVGAVAHTKQGLSPDFREQLVYAWQLYLPRLPFMKDEFMGGWPPWDLWYRGLLGRFGWLDYQFPQWVAWTVLPLIVMVVAAALSGLVRLRSLVRGRWLELGVYVLFALGLLGTIAVAGYRARLVNDEAFEQARYLLPLLPLFAGLVAVAARALGRRWGAALGGLVVMASIALTVFGELLTLGRYYG